MTLRDTAVISNGFNETGAITFTLYLGSTLVDTETVPINGDGNLYDADGLHAADDRHRDRHLPVGRDLPGRRRQYAGQREQRRGRASDGEPGQPVDRDDAERDLRDAWGLRR